MTAAKGTCPACKGKGVETIDYFTRLCLRCGGGGIAKLNGSERSSDFYKKQQQGTAIAEQRRAAAARANPSRSFSSGVEVFGDIKRRRDAIRHEERRFTPPWEPRPDAETRAAEPCPADDWGFGYEDGA